MKDFSYSKFEAQKRGFTMPVLHTGKKWYVDFYAVDQVTGKMRRKRVSVPGNLPLRQMKEQASYLISTITQRLLEGESPWADNSCVNGRYAFTPFKKCVKQYITTLDRFDRKKTRDSYLSRINMLLKYLDGSEQPIKYVWEFDAPFCKCFLEWIRNENDDGPRTYNNYRGWLHGFAEFLVAHRFIIRNPIDEIPVVPEYEKFRKDLTPQMLQRMSAYLK